MSRQDRLESALGVGRTAARVAGRPPGGRPHQRGAGRRRRAAVLSAITRALPGLPPPAARSPTHAPPPAHPPLARRARAAPTALLAG